MTKSGLTWSEPDATGRPLLENMSQNAAALSGLKTLIISPASRFPIPVYKLRKGGDMAAEAMRQVPLSPPLPVPTPPARSSRCANPARRRRSRRRSRPHSHHRSVAGAAL